MELEILHLRAPPPAGPTKAQRSPSRAQTARLTPAGTCRPFALAAFVVSRAPARAPRPLPRVAAALARSISFSAKRHARSKTPYRIAALTLARAQRLEPAEPAVGLLAHRQLHQEARGRRGANHRPARGGGLGEHGGSYRRGKPPPTGAGAAVGGCASVVAFDGCASSAGRDVSGCAPVAETGSASRRITGFASGLGASRATSASISSLVRRRAAARISAWFSVLRCRASISHGRERH